MINQETKGARLHTISRFCQEVEGVIGREACEHQANASISKYEHPRLLDAKYLTLKVMHFGLFFFAIFTFRVWVDEIKTLLKKLIAFKS